MDIRVLRYFIAVANEETISAAAKRLHLTQPTLSRQLKELETELGTTLFVRGKRKISLTEEGLFLLKKAQEIVELADKAEADLKRPKEAIAGDIHIGAGETHAMQLIAKASRKLAVRHPDIRFHLYSGNADDIAEKLDKGLLDFGVVIEPSDKRKYDYLRLPAADVWGVLMRKDSPLAEKPSIKPADLVGQPLLVSRQTAVGNEISGWFGRDAGELNITASYNLLYNATWFVEENIGYALCIDQLINTSGTSNFCFRPLEPKLEASLNFVWKKHQAFSSAARAFLDQVREEIARADGAG